MTQYVAMALSKHGEVVQVFGPYNSEELAQAGIDRMESWPALRVADWHIQELTPDPEPKPATIVVNVPANPWPQPLVTWTNLYSSYMSSNVVSRPLALVTSAL